MTKRIRRFLLLLLLSAFVSKGLDAWAGLRSTTVCKRVGQAALLVAPRNNARRSFTISTTSGAPMVWWTVGTAVNGAPVVHGINSNTLGGNAPGLAFTEDAPDKDSIATDAIYAVSLNTSWVCVKTNQ